ncbi:MAG: hemolysin family protein [Acidipropionibacterium sp.]|jgi:CBS domain containing-hemolysin-like protein|nr:hemolysin family protein [Acidipropionibacterium sp.]
MSPALGILITVALLGVNAFFVAGEFAVTSSRLSQIEPLREQGRRGSAKAMFALEHVSHMLSICQLGVTVASTTLGAVAEPAIAHLLADPLHEAGLPASSSHLVALVVALLIVVFLHVVFGEMVPKNISIAMPQNALLLLAPPLVVIGAALAPVIHAMDRTADWFVRLAGLTPRSEIAAAFTAEEVASIVERSEEEGKIHDELGLLSGSLEFTDRTAADAMAPLDELVMVPAGTTPAELEHQVSVTGYSRFPVVERGTIIGYLHVKDVLYAQGAEHDRPIGRDRIRAMDRVRVGAEVEDAMRQMQRTGIHCAEVVDDADRVVGVLFLEDILEELVGEVRDALQRR